MFTKIKFDSDGVQLGYMWSRDCMEVKSRLEEGKRLIDLYKQVDPDNINALAYKTFSAPLVGSCYFKRFNIITRIYYLKSI